MWLLALQISYFLILPSTASGFPARAGVHGDADAAADDDEGLLATGEGQPLFRHCHAQQHRRKKSGK